MDSTVQSPVNHYFDEEIVNIKLRRKKLILLAYASGLGITSILTAIFKQMPRFTLWISQNTRKVRLVMLIIFVKIFLSFNHSVGPNGTLKRWLILCALPAPLMSIHPTLKLKYSFVSTTCLIGILSIVSVLAPRNDLSYLSVGPIVSISGIVSFLMYGIIRIIQPREYQRIYTEELNLLKQCGIILVLSGLFIDDVQGVISICDTFPVQSTMYLNVYLLSMPMYLFTLLIFTRFLKLQP